MKQVEQNPPKSAICSLLCTAAQAPHGPRAAECTGLPGETQRLFSQFRGSAPPPPVGGGQEKRGQSCRVAKATGRTSGIRFLISVLSLVCFLAPGSHTVPVTLAGSRVGREQHAAQSRGPKPRRGTAGAGSARWPSRARGAVVGPGLQGGLVWCAREWAGGQSGADGRQRPTLLSAPASCLSFGVRRIPRTSLTFQSC